MENAEVVTVVDPERDTLCELLLAPSVNVREALKLPAAVGLNTTLAEQLAAAARLVPHVLVEMAKAAALAPEMAILLMGMAALVPLLNVTICAELVEPTAVAAKDTPAGAAVTVPVPLEPVAVPDKATLCGLPVPVSVNLSVALRAPATVGAKIMSVVQLAEAARLVPQVLLKIVKSLGSVPEIAMLPMVMAVVPLFVSVIAFCAPLPATGTEAQLRLAGETVAAARYPADWKAHNPRQTCSTVLKITVNGC
jgi:hypothetical protein